IISTINTSPKNKATGLLGISNEILKHLLSIAISYLIVLGIGIAENVSDNRSSTSILARVTAFC
ncbi:11707_t:CDS:2, partial [Scutellospora calospora]